MKTKRLIFDSSYEAEKVLMQKFPNAYSVVCAAFGISHSYYENGSLHKKIAETRYTYIKTNTFIGVKVELIILD